MPYGHHYLYLYIEDNELRNEYETRIINHNKNISNAYYDSGFDLLVPEQHMVSANCLGYTLSSKVVSALYSTPIIDKMYKKYTTGFYVYPRSSISKTPLRVSNSVGIIDSGYRGHLIGKLDNLTPESYTIEKYSRLFQICAPDLSRIQVELVNSIEELGITERGDGGFGSTGK